MTSKVLQFEGKPKGVKALFVPFEGKESARYVAPPDDHLCVLALLDLEDPSQPERTYCLGYWLDKFSVWIDDDGRIIDETFSRIVTHFLKLDEEM